MPVTTSQWRRALTPLLEGPSAWVFSGKMAYRLPVGWVLLGVHGAGSQRKKDHLYVQTIRMPLFVPSDVLTLTHGERVPDGVSALTPEGSAFVDAVSMAIRRVGTEPEALQAFASDVSEEGDYALILLGELQEAARRLELDPAPGDTRPFVEAMRHRRRTVLEALDRHGADGALQLLRDWRNETMTAIRIDA